MPFSRTAGWCEEWVAVIRRHPRPHRLGRMSELHELATDNPHLNAEAVDWLQLLMGDWQFISDLAFADLVIWVCDAQGEFVAVAHARPSSSNTVFYRDIVGKRALEQWRGLIADAYETGRPAASSSPDWFDQAATRLKAIPVCRVIADARGARHRSAPIAVITRHTNLSEARTPSRLELAYLSCANDLLDMISAGDFPDPDAPSEPRRGAPRVSDGLLRLDVDGDVTFASPNALSAFNRLGYKEEMEGGNLAEIVTSLLPSRRNVDESLPVVVTGRAPWRTELDISGVIVTLRAVPIKVRGVRTGALILCRDVTDLRRQEQELLTKDATIREIHHRVKNNLQTVASLLRIQARRSHTDEAREALLQAMRRVSSIAVVHDTLASGLRQDVNFDEVFDRVLMLTTEVASTHNTHVGVSREGTFGTLPSEAATPLALALNELVTNAVEHGLNGQTGELRVTVSRDSEHLVVVVADNGVGLPEGRVGAGLGTQIVRTLVEGELGGTIDWHTMVGSGTEVTVTIPIRWEQTE